MRKARFTFLCDEQERRLITALAERMQRSQGDTIRVLVKDKAQELQIDLEEPIQVKIQAEGVERG